ncbi:MAG: lactonase family protein, partial [Gammaproteobacteria bacterium]|nr:lactonase family protein [Gammaproteobacteria bacterium]
MKPDIQRAVKGGFEALLSMALIAGFVLLTGCPAHRNEPANAPPLAHASGFRGTVFGGRQPIVDSRVVAYAAGTTVGSLPTQIGEDFTDSSGNFTMSFAPSPLKGQLIYIVASGGISIKGGSDNEAIGLMTVAGIQGSPFAPVVGTVNINELTTVASTAVLKDYIGFADCPTIPGNSRSGTCLSIPGAPGLASMAATVNRLVNVINGQASEFLTFYAMTPSSNPPLKATLEKLDTLASILAACVNSADPGSGACSGLFDVTGGSSSTLMSAWRIAEMPAINMKAGALFGLLPASPIYTPYLSPPSADTDAGYWTMGGEPYVLAADFNGNEMSVWQLGVHEGGLTELASSPIAAVDGPDSVVVDPTGRYVYVANRNAGSVSAYTIGVNGALTELSFSPFDAGASPAAITVDPSGRYVYVANSGGNNVSMYLIGSGGVLGLISGYACGMGLPSNCTLTGTSPQALTVDPTGSYLYVAN